MIHESASDWLLRIAPVVKRLNEESLGDCAERTVAGVPSGLSHSSVSQAKPLIDYRKESKRD